MPDRAKVRPSRPRPASETQTAVLNSRLMVTLLGIFVALCLPLAIQQVINIENRMSSSRAERLACEHFLRLDPGWLTGVDLLTAMSNDRLVLPTHFNTTFTAAEEYLQSNLESAQGGSLRVYALPREIVANVSDTAMIATRLQIDSALHHSERGTLVAFVDLPWPQVHPEALKVSTPCGTAQQVFTLELKTWDKGQLRIVSIQGQSVMGSQILNVTRP